MTGARTAPSSNKISAMIWVLRHAVEFYHLWFPTRDNLLPIRNKKCEHTNRKMVIEALRCSKFWNSAQENNHNCFFKMDSRKKNLWFGTDGIWLKSPFESGRS